MYFVGYDRFDSQLKVYIVGQWKGGMACQKLKLFENVLVGHDRFDSQLIICIEGHDRYDMPEAKTY